MSRNFAVVIGNNQYDFFVSLKYAKRDAELVSQFLLNEAMFDQVYLFSDDSPDISTGNGSFVSSRPYYANLSRFLSLRFEQPFLSEGDNLWFFFAGHGLRFNDQDFLIPSDGDPSGVEETALSVRVIAERLRRSGADNILLFIDACRNDGARGAIGIGQDAIQGLIIFFSCSPRERSYEIDEIQQGSFAYALVEGLRIQGEGSPSTIKKLDQYLRFRVPEINGKYGKPPQTPYASVEPSTKVHLIRVC